MNYHALGFFGAGGGHLTKHPMFQFISDVDFKYKKLLKFLVALGVSKKLGSVFIQKMIYPIGTSWEFMYGTKCSFIHLIQNSGELLEVMVPIVKGRAIVLISIVRATCLC